MATTAASNYTASGAAFRKPGLSTDQFEAGFLITGLNALDLHDHSSGLGLGVGRLQTGSTPDAAGEVQVTGDSLVWWGATAGATRSAVAIEGTQTITGVKTFNIDAYTNGLIVVKNDSATGSSAIVHLRKNTTGTPANSMGPTLEFEGESSTTVGQAMATVGALWTDVTDATRTAALRFLTVNSASFAERARITGPGNLKIAGTADRATTEGTNHLDIFDGTAPVGTLANGISLYSTAGELRVMDAAGNATLLSPHDAEGRWVFDSFSPITGKRLRVDMERLVRWLDTHFGLGFVQEFAQ